jgi:hypothetical protein
MEDFIQTRGSKHVENAEKLHSIITYQTYKPSNTTKINDKSNNIRNNRIKQHDDVEADNDSKLDEKTRQEKEMKRFRYDIIKFGMSGLDKQKFKHAKMALAISLGAKPPKNKRKNYKKLIEERKKIAAQEAKKLKFASGFSASKLLMKHKNKDNSKSNTKKSKKSNGILDIYGKVDKTKTYKKKNQKNQKT